MQSQQANKQTLVTYLLALKAGEKEKGGITCKTLLNYYTFGQRVDGFKKYA